MRIRDWRFAFAVLILCGLAEASWAQGPATTQAIIVQHPDPDVQREFQNVYQAITNPTISSATIGSATISSMTVTKKITVPNGVAATDAAAFGQIVTSSITFTDWASYTPTFVGIGTPTGVAFFWRQIGNTIFIKGVGTTGVCTAVNFAFSVPSGKTINGTKTQLNFVLGNGDRLYLGATGGLSRITYYYNNDSSNLYGSQQIGAGAYVNTLGNALFNNGDSFTVDASYAL